MKRGYEVGICKSQVANIFHNQKALAKVQLSPLEAIEEYTGLKRGSIKANFYDDCTTIPDPTELDVVEKNLLILDDCFLGPQNKAEAYYTRGRHNNCDTFYISQNYFRLPCQTIRENANFIILFPQDAKSLMQYTPIIVTMICLYKNSKTTVEKCGMARATILSPLI